MFLAYLVQSELHYDADRMFVGGGHSLREVSEPNKVPHGQLATRWIQLRDLARSDCCLQGSGLQEVKLFSVLANQSRLLNVAQYEALLVIEGVNDDHAKSGLQSSTTSRTVRSDTAGSMRSSLLSLPFTSTLAVLTNVCISVYLCISFVNVCGVLQKLDVNWSYYRVFPTCETSDEQLCICGLAGAVLLGFCNKTHATPV